LATGHFSGKFFPKIAGSGHAGSNDTGLKSVSRPGAEPIECQTHTQNTSIIYIEDIYWSPTVRSSQALGHQKLFAISDNTISISVLLADI
jgi:hypothetical protein